VHDTVDLEARGVPTVFVATVEFIDGAVAQARALGADPAGVYVEHPIQDRTDEEMLAIADQAIDAIVANLVGGGAATARGARER
jgi:hypothetical protein